MIQNNHHTHQKIKKNNHHRIDSINSNPIASLKPKKKKKKKKSKTKKKRQFFFWVHKREILWKRNKLTDTKHSLNNKTRVTRLSQKKKKKKKNKSDQTLDLRYIPN